MDFDADCTKRTISPQILKGAMVLSTLEIPIYDIRRANRSEVVVIQIDSSMPANTENSDVPR